MADAFGLNAPIDSGLRDDASRRRIKVADEDFTIGGRDADVDSLPGSDVGDATNGLATRPPGDSRDAIHGPRPGPGIDDYGADDALEAFDAAFAPEKSPVVAAAASAGAFASF